MKKPTAKELNKKYENMDLKPKLYTNTINKPTTTVKDFILKYDPLYVTLRTLTKGIIINKQDAEAFEFCERYNNEIVGAFQYFETDNHLILHI